MEWCPMFCLGSDFSAGWFEFQVLLEAPGGLAVFGSLVLSNLVCVVILCAETTC